MSDKTASDGLPQSWISQFSCFSGLTEWERERVASRVRHVTVPPGANVFEPERVCPHYILLQQGSVRVHLSDAEGHAITLYRLKAGDSCVLATAAILANEPYAACATTEDTVSAVLMETEFFHQLLGSSSSFRRAIFESHGRRIVELMAVIGDVAFARIDQRLARRLHELSGSGPGPDISITHDALALDLGTAREVVSRRMKEFERRGWLSLHKGKVKIFQLDALAECGRR